MKVKQIENKDEKERISRLILESLNKWFEIEESREMYIRQSVDKVFFGAFDEDKAVGFLYLKPTGKDTVELAVMGVLEEYHRNGVGRILFENAEKAAKNAGFSFIQVKTVKMGTYDDYDKTNKFYQVVGFKEFEVFPELWDEQNPCQIYVKSL